MKTFYTAPAAEQSLLMVSMFLTLILAIITAIVFLSGRRGIKAFVNSVVFLIMFALLSVLTEEFVRAAEGTAPGIHVPVPMPVLWLIVAGADIMLLLELLGESRKRRHTINRNSVKEAMDRLPDGICYFNRNGSVKLCSLQMNRIVRALTQKDLQNYSELREALEECGPDTGVICLSKELQNYLFPDGRVWLYREYPVKDNEGNTYTEAVFSDITEQYYKELELKKQTEELKEVSRRLRRLSDNVIILSKEKEVLAAKTKLHDRMGAGLTALRQLLTRQSGEGAENAVKLLRQAVSEIKNDNEYPQEKDDLEKFIQDAGTVGVKINLSGNLPEQEELSHVFLMAMRECLSNGVRHAGASELWIEINEDENSVSVNITNDGVPPEKEVVPKGGLHNLYRYAADWGGSMKIQSEPSFELTVTLPKDKEEQG